MGKQFPIGAARNFIGSLTEKYPSLFLRLGRLETRWMRRSILDVPIDRPIFITGLARSGSTILLRMLASHPSVATHQYKDFPFLHIPVLGNRFFNQVGQKERPLVERPHKDRIMISLDSPEAMEEVIWMSHFPDLHEQKRSSVMSGREDHPEFESFYRNHIRKMLFIRGGKRYLAKGNYNISRLEYINHLFPDARFIIPVRNPINHIASLMKQHRLLCDAAAHNPRVVSHMRRVGHFEFGPDRRVINFDCLDTVRRIEKLWSEGKEVRGWAVYWTSVYSFVADLFEKNQYLANQILIVYYSDLCEKPSATLQQIYDYCDLEVMDHVVQEQALNISAPTYYNPNFSKNDIEDIQEETKETVKRIQEIAQNKNSLQPV